MSNSLAATLAALPDGDRDQLLTTLDPATAQALLVDWRFWARPEQLPPAGLWGTWLLLCGRGFGKSRTTSETLLTWVVDNPRDIVGNPTEWLIAGKTHTATVNAMLRGPSGLFQALRARSIDYTWNKVEHTITLTTGQIIHHTHGDDEDLARGLNLSGAALDEFGTWKRAKTAYREGLTPALRAVLPGGQRPRVLIATTPKVARKDALEILASLVKRAAEGDPNVVVTRGTTFDNAANLAASELEEWLTTYPKGSRAYRQELLAELLDEVEGAIWEDFAWIDDHRVRPAEVPDIHTWFVSVDPAVTSGPESDLTGIIVGGVGKPTNATENHAYLTEDLSGRYPSSQWVTLVVKTAAKKNALILVEVDQGGDVWEDLIKAEAKRQKVVVRVETVRASSIGSKSVRAQGVVGYYQQGRVHHVGTDLDKLETQQTTWVPGDDSPDRIDAAVYLVRKALTVATPRLMSTYVEDAY